MKPDEVKDDIRQGLARCNLMLDGRYAGRSLAVRITARLYALRADLHRRQRNLLLADADWAYSLGLDPFQQKVRTPASARLRFSTPSRP